MVDKPRLKAHLAAVAVDGDKVFITADDRHWLLTGPACVAVLPFLDGTSGVADIAAALSGSVDAFQIMLAIRKFEACGVLADGRPDGPGSGDRAAFWDSIGADPARAAATAAGIPISVLTLGSCDATDLLAALRGLELQATAVESAADAPGLLVAVTDDHLRPELAAINEAALAAGRPWLLVRAAGSALWYGPLFTPGSSGCWECLRHRLAGNRLVERYLAMTSGESTPLALPSGSHLVVPAAAAVIAAEVARIAGTGTSPALDGRMVVLDLAELSTSKHVLVRRPQCPACGDPAVVRDRPSKIVLGAGAEQLRQTDGGLRSQSFQETFSRLERHISPYIGAVSGLWPFPGVEETGVTFSYTAGHNFALIRDNVDLLRRNLRGQSGGKGRTEIQAKVSAICEAVERYSGVYDGDEPSVRAAFEDLPAGSAVHPHDVLLFSDQQYADREAYNADPVNRKHKIPRPFRTDEPIDWTPSWSLTAQREVLVPAGLVWYGHPDLERHLYSYTESNGSAAGNTLDEAILQGFCELVERDSVALWWYNKLRRPAFDLASLKEPYTDELREFYAGLGRSLWLLDLTADLGVPAFAGVSHRIGRGPQDIMLGFGAHPIARIAALRALTEVNQMLPGVQRRDDGGGLFLDEDPSFVEWLQNTTIEDEPWLCPDDTQPARTAADYSATEPDDLAGCIADCAERAAAAGLEVLVVDQSRPDLDLNVAKVIIPGLRHFWYRTAPGRLYDVPVRMGWLQEPTPEDRLNTTSVFF